MLHVLLISFSWGSKLHHASEIWPKIRRHRRLPLNSSTTEGSQPRCFLLPRPCSPGIHPSFSTILSPSHSRPSSPCHSRNCTRCTWSLRRGCLCLCHNRWNLVRHDLISKKILWHSTSCWTCFFGQEDARWTVRGKEDEKVPTILDITLPYLLQHVRPDVGVNFLVFLIKLRLQLHNLSKSPTLVLGLREGRRGKRDLCCVHRRRGRLGSPQRHSLQSLSFSIDLSALNCARRRWWLNGFRDGKTSRGTVMCWLKSSRSAGRTLRTTPLVWKL